MGYSLKWIIPEQLLQVRVWGYITLKEFRLLNHAVVDCMENSESDTIHVLLDERQLEEIQGSLMSLQAVAAMFYHHRAGSWLMVGEGHPHLNFLYSTIARLEKIEYQRFDDCAAAVAFLIERTPELTEIMAVSARLISQPGQRIHA